MSEGAVEVAKDEQKSFILYHSHYELMEDLTINERGVLISAIFEYQLTGTIPEDLPPLVKVVFKAIKQDMDANSNKWEEIRKARSEAGRKGGRPKKQADINENEKAKKAKVFLENQKKHNVDVNVDVDVDVDVNKHIEDGTPSDVCVCSEKPQHKSSVRPTVDEVTAYCKERHNNVNAEEFIDYYKSNGWRVGKNPMTDWKACVRNWERRNSGVDATKANTQAIKPTKFINYNQPTYTADEINAAIERKKERAKVGG